MFVALHYNLSDQTIPKITLKRNQKRFIAQIVLSEKVGNKDNLPNWVYTERTPLSEEIELDDTLKPSTLKLFTKSLLFMIYAYLTLHAGEIQLSTEFDWEWDFAKTYYY